MAQIWHRYGTDQTNMTVCSVPAAEVYNMFMEFSASYLTNLFMFC